MSGLMFRVKTDKPTTLQNYLTGQAGVSKRLLTKLKRQDNGITRNGEKIRSIDLVYDGDEILLSFEDSKYLEPNGNLDVKIAFENENVVIFDKPSGMPVHPSIKHQGDTLGNFFAYRYPSLTFRPINRLDSDTSGLCAVAKNAYSAQQLQGSIEKVYYAAAEGIIDESGTIDAPIARQQESIIVRCVREDGQRAVTHYNRIRANGRFSLAEVHLETGRTHQIRVHFSHIGHALAGDDMYGGGLEFIKRQALHCGQLTFDEPVSREKITVKLPLSADIMKLFEEENEMKRIKSFEVDHTKFGVGMYTSRIDGDITTYDVRMVKPNGGVYLETPAMHTIEHLFATYARNTEYSDKIVYVGPMGCRTGFYFLVRDLAPETAIKIVRDSFEFVRSFEGDIPGATEVECGNYREHDLEGAKKSVEAFLAATENYTAEMLEYNWHMK